MIITVNTDNRSYDVVVRRGVIREIREYLDLERKVLIVTDNGVPEEYAASVAACCSEPVIITIPQGEESKSFSELKKLISVMLKASFTREDCVIAVGGGVVGDLSGYAASCYMRGIDFINIPTTLLSQVDSSVGGKTGIDFEGVKNIVGSFYQPEKVLIDPDVLSTLEERQLHAGLAESIKMAMICDRELFLMIEQTEDLYSDLSSIIERSLKIKRDFVEKDPTEDRLRRALNFGHTLGHALESACKGELLHGECVALGMLPFCGRQAGSRLSKLLEKYKLPTKMVKEWNQLLPYILHDKKMQADGIETVFVDEIGSYAFRKMTVQEIYSCLESVQ